MVRRDLIFLRSLFSYVLASIACLLYILWPHFEGHPHAPFSSFPEFLVWAPISPYMAFVLFETRASEAVTALVIFGLVFAASYAAMTRVGRGIRGSKQPERSPKFDTET